MFGVIIYLEFYFKNDDTPLHRAVENNNIEIVKYLLKQQNINVNIRNAAFFNYLKFFL